MSLDARERADYERLRQMELRLKTWAAEALDDGATLADVVAALQALKTAVKQPQNGR